MARSHLTVLLIEDNSGDARLIELALAEAGGDDIRLLRAERLDEGLERLAVGGVDVVLLDLSLPDSHGLETFQRARSEVPSVPIVVLSGMSDEQLAVHAVNEGAQDYLVKGRVDGEDLKRAIRYAMERHEAMSELRQLALDDELTGLRNRRGFMTLGEQVLKRSGRSGSPLALIFIDVNGMKEINDSFGHHEGDRALRDVAEVLTNALRTSDVIARIGGDEFCALLELTNAVPPEVSVDRIREHLLEFNNKAARPYRLSLSVGAKLYDSEKPCSLEDLIESADQLMYRQKMGAERRQRLLVADDDPVLRRLAEAIFGDGYEVSTAATGSEALELAKRGRFDLFLLDVRLPDRLGTEVVQDIRSDPATSRTPIILMTGLEDAAVEVEGLRMGVDDFVRKPFNPEALVSRVENAIIRARRR